MNRCDSLTEVQKVCSMHMSTVEISTRKQCMQNNYHQILELIEISELRKSIPSYVNSKLCNLALRCLCSLKLEKISWTPYVLHKRRDSLLDNDNTTRECGSIIPRRKEAKCSWSINCNQVFVIIFVPRNRKTPT